MRNMNQRTFIIADFNSEGTVSSNLKFRLINNDFNDLEILIWSNSLEL